MFEEIAEQDRRDRESDRRTRPCDARDARDARQSSERMGREYASPSIPESAKGPRIPLFELTDTNE